MIRTVVLGCIPIMAIHVAITRRVRPGCEAVFQEALREFFQASFAHSAVLGANMLVPPPGSDSREFGILRSFGSEAERDAFYASPVFRAWEERASAFTEGVPVYRQLHGLEAWFRAPGAPPRWKMAVLTFVAVYPMTSLVPPISRRVLAPLNPLLINLASTAVIVAALTWVIMPLLTRLVHRWLRAGKT